MSNKTTKIGDIFVEVIDVGAGQSIVKTTHDCKYGHDITHMYDSVIFLMQVDALAKFLRENISIIPPTQKRFP